MGSGAKVRPRRNDATKCHQNEETSFLTYLIESGEEAIGSLGTGQLRLERFVGCAHFGNFVSVFFGYGGTLKAKLVRREEQWSDVAFELEGPPSSWNVMALLCKIGPGCLVLEGSQAGSHHPKRLFRR